MAVTYTLRYRPAGSESWTEVTGLTSTSQAVTGLTAGTEYEVEVVAVSDGGVQSTPVTGGRWTLFGQPSAPSTTPAGYALSSDDNGTNGAIDVSWTAVAGATSYTVSHRKTDPGDDAWVEVAGLSGTSTRLEGLDGATTHEVRVAVVNGDDLASTPSTAITGSAAVATGGTVTSFDGDGTIGVAGTTYVVHTFTTVGTSTLTLNRERALDYLLVAGGGGGGQGTPNAHGGGGGGAGEFKEVTALDLSASTPSVTVGAGGLGGVDAGAVGGDTSFNGDTVAGGGGGASYNVVATSGGSGGGGAHSGDEDPRKGASSNATGAGKGNSGGNATGNGFQSAFAAGGGGADGTGKDSSTGDGGNGRVSTITGASVSYAGGGGGGAKLGNETASEGGSGGGGDGGFTTSQNQSTAAGKPGQDGTGGGGGGGSGYIYTSFGGGDGGAGGSGVVIVRYALP